MDTSQDQAFERATFARITWRLLPLLFAGYVAAFLDRVNVGFAKLQMASDLKYSDTVYSIGAGIFFLGYFVFEVPSNVILEKVGARPGGAEAQAVGAGHRADGVHAAAV